MKNLIFILTICVFPYFCLAQQENQTGKILKNPAEVFKPDSNYHKFSNRFDIKRENKKPEFSENKLNENLKNQRIAEEMEFRMPVYNLNGYNSKMPVLVPDSSVHYYLKIKKIEGNNPSENKR